MPSSVTYNASTDTATLSPDAALVSSTTYTATVSGAQDAAGDAMTTTVSWLFTTATAPVMDASIWSSSTTPGRAFIWNSNAIEVGVKFEAATAGTISGIRFYKGMDNTGPHIGYLWTDTGTLLASATFTNESRGGWQQVNFATPVTITAGTIYIASYLAPNGFYADDQGYFATSGVTNGPLTALSNAAADGNGVYLQGLERRLPREYQLREQLLGRRRVHECAADGHGHDACRGGDRSLHHGPQYHCRVR